MSSFLKENCNGMFEALNFGADITEQKYIKLMYQSCVLHISI